MSTLKRKVPGCWKLVKLGHKFIGESWEALPRRILMFDKTKELAKKIKEAGGTLYVTGGAVRDHLLGRSVHDIDLVVFDLDVMALVDVLDVESVGSSFPVFIKDGFEIAMGRTEENTGPGHTDYIVKFGADVTLEEDAFRRDLTINALYADPLTGEIVDPYGGRNDLDARILRPVSIKHFGEDPLRVFRVGRFLSELPDFEVDYSMYPVCRETATSFLSGERVAQETERAFMGALPYRYFRFLYMAGALAVWFPEIEKMMTVVDRHNGTTWAHVMAMLAEPCSPQVGWSVLVHDIGKTETDPADYPSHHGHENCDRLAKEFLSRFALSSRIEKVALLTQKYHMKCHRAPSSKSGTLWDMCNDIKDMTDFMVLAEVHFLDANSAERDDNYCYIVDIFQLWQLSCDQHTGDEVMEKHGLAPGPRVGEILRGWRINEFHRLRSQLE